MRYFLLLALLLYNIVTKAERSHLYDYDDPDGIKRHSFADERRNWRKKALLKSFEQEHKEWDDRRYDRDIPGYSDGPQPKQFGGLDRPQDMDPSARGQRHYDEDEKMNMLHRTRSAEASHLLTFPEKELQKKTPYTMTCEKQNERYESCFAGCAAVTCDNPRERLRPCYPFCEPGCVCTQPHVRDDRTHKCVLPEDCSKGLKGIPDLGEDT